MIHRTLKLYAALLIISGLAYISGCGSSASSGPQVLPPELEQLGAKVARNAVGKITTLQLRCDNEDLAHLKPLVDLERLVLTGSEIKDDGLAVLKNCKHLQVLDLRKCPKVGDDGAIHLSGLTKMKDLKIGGITSGGLKHLENLQALQVLFIDKSGVDDEGMKVIAGFKNLEQLSMAQSKITDEGMASLAGLTKLKRLRMPEVKVGDDGLTHLSKLTSLQNLDLSQTMVGDEGVKHLQNLNELTDLNLWLTKITDEGLKSVAAMPNIKWLNLDNTPITDDGLKQLAKLKKLEWLHLGRCRLTDEAIPHLTVLSGLKHLIVTNIPKISDDGLAKLRQALPDCEIEGP